MNKQLKKVEAPKPYKYEAYPKMVYHKDYAPKMVQDEADHAALGEGWIASPSHVDKPQYPKVVHHKKYAPKIVNSEKEHAVLGSDWGYVKSKDEDESEELVKEEKPKVKVKGS